MITDDLTSMLKETAKGGEVRCVDIGFSHGRVPVKAPRGTRLLQADDPEGPWRRCGKIATKRYVKAVKK